MLLWAAAWVLEFVMGLWPLNLFLYPFYFVVAEALFHFHTKKYLLEQSASPHQTATSSDQQPTHWRMSDAARRALASWYESALHCSDSARSRASRSNSRSTMHEKRRKEATRVTAQAAPPPARADLSNPPDVSERVSPKR